MNDILGRLEWLILLAVITCPLWIPPLLFHYLEQGDEAVLIDERTRLRITIAIFVAFMVAALNLKTVVIWILIVAAGFYLIRWAVARWDERQKAAGAARQAIVDRMFEQHRQASAGDERGVYGDGYLAHRKYERATEPRMPPTADPSDESTWGKPCWNCGHVPGCAWVEDAGFAACPECSAD